MNAFEMTMTKVFLSIGALACLAVDVAAIASRHFWLVFAAEISGGLLGAGLLIPQLAKFREMDHR